MSASRHSSGESRQKRAQGGVAGRVLKSETKGLRGAEVRDDRVQWGVDGRVLKSEMKGLRPVLDLSSQRVALTEDVFDAGDLIQGFIDFGRCLICSQLGCTCLLPGL